MEAETLKDVLLSVNGEVIGKFGNDELRGEAEGGNASGEWAGGRGSDERSLVTVVFAAEFWADEAPLDQTRRLVVEKFGDFMADEFELIFVLLVSLWVEGLFDDFELVPAFEAAVIFTLRLFYDGLCFVCPLQFFGLVSRGGFGLFRRKAFEEELELSGVNLFAFDAIEDLKQSVDFLLKGANTSSLFFNDPVFVFGCLNGFYYSKFWAK